MKKTGPGPDFTGGSTLQKGKPLSGVYLRGERAALFCGANQHIGHDSLCYCQKRQVPHFLFPRRMSRSLRLVRIHEQQVLFISRRRHRIANGSLQFRGGFYNSLNHAQFAKPETNFTSSTFGVISSTSVSARVDNWR